MTETVTFAPFPTELKNKLHAMIHSTGFGGANALERHCAALSDLTPNPAHLICAILHKKELIGWISIGAATDTSDTEAVIRCYLDCIYIEPASRGLGYASTALSDVAQALSAVVFRELLPQDDNIIPLDVELSAIHVNDEGEHCVNVFQRSMSHSVSLFSNRTNYVYREFVNESKRGA